MCSLYSFCSFCARHTTIVGFVFCKYSMVGRYHAGSLSIEV